MRKKLLGLSLVVAVFFSAGQNVFAQDVDLTSLIVNNDFEYVAEGVPHTWTTWKPKDAATNQGYTEFYGWTCDISVLGGNSQGFNKDFQDHHGTYGCWIGSTDYFPEFWEFSQTITGLDAGKYKVQCLLSSTKKTTSQRLFANNNVQYYASEADYENNQTAGEIATFANYPKPTNATVDAIVSEMEVYTTIEANEPLKIGIRTGGILSDGSVAPKANPAYGWFKVDYFRLTKVDDNPNSIDNAEGDEVSYTVNNGKLTVEGVDAYSVYSINGVKVADVKDAAGTSVDLGNGIYILQTQNAKTYKVLVR